jgi:3-phosphoglycerate kinase
MVFTFYKARGLGVGSSLVEEDQLELAKKLEKVAAVSNILHCLLHNMCYMPCATVFVGTKMGSCLVDEDQMSWQTS